MIKLFTIIFCIFIICGPTTSCKKQTAKIENSIEGIWELRKITGAWSTTNFQTGNGYTISFSGNKYEIKEGGQITQSGLFTITTDHSASQSTCSILPAGQFSNRIIYDNNMNGPKTFFELSADKLTLLSGCSWYDARVFRDYERQ